MEKQMTIHPRYVVGKGRLEMLFDGIFAIAMTLLVLELKIPELADRRSVSELAAFLSQHGAAFFSYFLSFGLLGLLWYRHNWQYRCLQQVTRGIVFLHLLQLSMAAFFPFCAGTFGHYPTNHLAMSLYTGCILVYQLCSTLEWMLAKKEGILSPDLPASDYTWRNRRNLRALILITALFLVSLTRALLNA